MFRSSFERVNQGTPNKMQQPTLLIFPDILENNIVVKELAHEFYQKNKEDRRIYTYNGLINPNLKADSLAEKAGPLVKELTEGSNTQNHPPVWLIGYSFGCSLAYAVAVQLKQLGYDPHLILIDGMSPKLAYQYFNTKHPNATKSIIKILQAAAPLHGLDSKLILHDLDSKLVKKKSSLYQEMLALHKEPVLDQINKITEKIIEQNSKVPTYKIENFKESIKVVKKNLLLLSNETALDNSEKLSKINVFMTEDMKNNYAQALNLDPDSLIHGGWDDYFISFKPPVSSNFIDEKSWEGILSWEQYANYPAFENLVNPIKATKHTHLMKGDICKLLAELLNFSIKTQLSEQDIFALLVKDKLKLLEGAVNSLNEYRNQYPEVGPSPIVDTLSKSLSTHSSGGSPNSTSPLEKEDGMEIDSNDSNLDSQLNSPQTADKNVKDTAIKSHHARLFSSTNSTGKISRHEGRVADRLRNSILRSPGSLSNGGSPY